MRLQQGTTSFPRHLGMAALTTTAVVLITLVWVAVIGAADAKLTFVEVHFDSIGGVDGLWDVKSVAVSPDGKHLYAAGFTDSAVGVFSRDPTTGALTFLESQRDDAEGVDGLGGVRFVTVSPDGKHLYAASQTDNAVAVFSRNSTTGSLTFVEAQQDGVGGVDGLFIVTSVTISPDGKHVYTTSHGDDAVAVFSRSSTTGALTFMEVQKDGVGGIDGLFAAASVVVSPDGKHVYTASIGYDAVAVFSRNSTTGALTFVEAHQDGVAGVDGLDGASSLASSPDGKHLYTTGQIDDAVAVFSVATTTNSTSTPTSTPSPTPTATPSPTPTSVAGAELSVTKSDSPDPVVAGSTLTYTIVVANNGTETSTSAVLTDTLPQV
jgi:uncharacterized repeat protein (TIGR01451 family)